MWAKIITKGKPWSFEIEKPLKGLVEAKAPLSVLAKKLDKPEAAVRQKVRRLGLEVVEQRKNICPTTSCLYRCQ